MRREFTRIAWASTTARTVWEPRVQAIQRAWADVELRSVAEGVRPAALAFGADVVAAAGLPRVLVAPDRFAVGPQAHELAEAYASQDDDAVGAFLGFPTCCRLFFGRVWNVEKKRDTTLSMGEPYAPAATIPANILGRWLGVRLVPHLPCAFDCQGTMEFERRLAPLWPRQEYAWAETILTWPVKYSALHGVAIITMPVVKVITNTDYTATEQIIERHGSSYPDEAPRGLGFPYNQRPKTLATVPLTSLRPDTWTANGFASKPAMETAHQRILDALREARPIGAVIDLGCGNGHLLEQIATAFHVPVHGVESDRAKTQAATVPISISRIQDVDLERSFDIALISDRRFDEFTTDERARVDRWLEAHVSRVLRYSYDDPITMRWIQMTGVCVS